MSTFTVKFTLKNYIGNVMDKSFVIKVLESVGIFLTYIYLNVIKHHYSSSNPHIYFKIYTLELFCILSLFFFSTFNHGEEALQKFFKVVQTHKIAMAKHNFWQIEIP